MPYSHGPHSFVIKELKHRPDCTPKARSRAWSTPPSQPHPACIPSNKQSTALSLSTLKKQTLQCSFFCLFFCVLLLYAPVAVGKQFLVQALGPFNNSTNNCILFLRLLACNGAAAALAPAVWEEREFVPRAKCIALGQLVPPNPRVHYLGGGNSPHSALSRNWSFQLLFQRYSIISIFPSTSPLLNSSQITESCLNEMCTLTEQVN